MPYKDKKRMREYHKNWIAARRLKFFTGKSCSVCGDTSNLELHHTVPHDKVAHKIWSWSSARRAKEIAKCIVLCDKCHDNCHGHKTKELLVLLRDFYAKHGKVPRFRDATVENIGASSSTFVRRFGSWRNALTTAGLLPPAESNTHWA